MLKGKSTAIVLTYGLLIYQFAYESPSVFVFLFAMFVELVLLWLVYVTAYFHLNKMLKIIFGFLLLGGIPFFLFNYWLMYLVAMGVDMLAYCNEPITGFWAPLIFFQSQLIVIATCILVGYVFETIIIWKKPNQWGLIASKIVKQGSVIWTLFISVIIALMFLLPAHTAIFIALPISRILLEGWLFKIENEILKT